MLSGAFSLEKYEQKLAVFCTLILLDWNILDGWLQTDRSLYMVISFSPVDL